MLRCAMQYKLRVRSLIAHTFCSIGEHCCNISWLLKNSLSAPNSPKLGDAKCLGIRERRLN